MASSALWMITVLIAAASARITTYLPHRNYLYFEGKDHIGAMVHLQEWPYEDIKEECKFLTFWGYNAILISPPVEHVVLDQPSWKERYMPISLKLESRSGTLDQLKAMIDQCKNKNYLRVFVDLNFNNMLMSTVATEVSGFAGTKAKPSEYQYDGFVRDEFNEQCKLKSAEDFNDERKVRECEVDDLQDLNNNVESLRTKHVNLMKQLFDMGVYGFRIAMAKYIYPAHLSSYYEELSGNIKNENSWADDPFMIHDVNDLDESAVKAMSYGQLGTFTEYPWSKLVGKYFLKSPDRNLDDIANIGDLDYDEELVSRQEERMVFLYNHITQNSQDPLIIKRVDKDPDNAKAYRMAMAFMLSWPYGIPMVLSSYKGDGAPITSDGKVKSPRPANTTTGRDYDEYECVAEYNCEHREPTTRRMAVFNNDVRDEPLTKFRGSKEEHWFGFTRGSVGFIFFNVGEYDVEKTFHVRLRAGEYCDVASGDIIRNECSGKSFFVDVDGAVTVSLDADDPLGYIALHLNSKIDPTTRVLGSLFGVRHNPPPEKQQAPPKTKHNSKVSSDKTDKSKPATSTPQVAATPDNSSEEETPADSQQPPPASSVQPPKAGGSEKKVPLARKDKRLHRSMSDDFE